MEGRGGVGGGGLRGCYTLVSGWGIKVRLKQTEKTGWWHRVEWVQVSRINTGQPRHQMCGSFSSITGSTCVCEKWAGTCLSYRPPRSTPRQGERERERS